MWPALVRLFTDQVYFTQVVRAVLMGLGAMLSSGALDLGKINDHLGPAGWWVGVFLMPLAVFLRAGDQTLATLAAATPHEKAEAGVAAVPKPDP